MEGLIESVLRTCRRVVLLRQSGVEPEGLAPGTAYVRRKTWGVVETAWISQVVEDAAGIRHIRFDLMSKHRDRIFVDGPRTMGVHSFLQQYRRVS